MNKLQKQNRMAFHIVWILGLVIIAVGIVNGMLLIGTEHSQYGINIMILLFPVLATLLFVYLRKLKLPAHIFAPIFYAVLFLFSSSLLILINNLCKFGNCNEEMLVVAVIPVVLGLPWSMFVKQFMMDWWSTSKFLGEFGFLVFGSLNIILSSGIAYLISRYWRWGKLNRYGKKIPASTQLAGWILVSISIFTALPLLTVVYITFIASQTETLVILRSVGFPSLAVLVGVFIVPLVIGIFVLRNNKWARIFGTVFGFVICAIGFSNLLHQSWIIGSLELFAGIMIMWGLIDTKRT